MGAANRALGSIGFPLLEARVPLTA
jgi:hypothetical protein